MKQRTVRLIIFVACSWILASGFSVSESQLSKLMLEMKSDMISLKEKVAAGEAAGKFNRKHYQKIYTAKVSSESKRGEHFTEYATAFLTQAERTYNASPQNLKLEYNNLVMGCIRCHETYCPGPLSMLKKMKLN